MIRTFAEWIGTVFYLGKLPLAPGTWTSLVATITWYFILKDLKIYIIPKVTSNIFPCAGHSPVPSPEHSPKQ